MKTNNKLFYREFNLVRDVLDEDEREIRLTFSSEAPVMRWFGEEILLHGKNNVSLERLRTVGSFIYGHNPSDSTNIIGPIKNVWLNEREKNCSALVGFDEDTNSERIMQKVKSGSLKGTSCGYNIKKARRLLEGEAWTDPDSGKMFKGPAVVATLWEPVEITATPIPADTSVGIGRELERSLDSIDFEIEKPLTSEAVTEIFCGLGLDNRAAENKGIIKLSMEQLQDIVSRSAAVSDDLSRRIIDEVLAGATEIKLKTMIRAELCKNPDAFFSAGCDMEDGRQREKTLYADIDSIPDDVFRASLKG
jgi:hypothetical protein